MFDIFRLTTAILKRDVHRHGFNPWPAISSVFLAEYVMRAYGYPIRRGDLVCIAHLVGNVALQEQLSALLSLSANQYPWLVTSFTPVKSFSLALQHAELYGRDLGAMAHMPLQGL